MKTCNECQRPQRGGFYRTKTNKVLCYDCFIRMKERVLDEQERAKRDHRMHGDEWMQAQKRVNELKTQINSQGYNVWESYGRYSVSNDAPFYIKQLISQMNEAEAIRKMHYDAGMRAMRSTSAAYTEAMGAVYCESEDEEREKFGNVL